MIALVFALDFEASAFAPAPLGTEIVILGCAGRAAGSAFRQQLATGPLPDLVVSAGLAGALDPALRVGQLFLAEGVAPLPPQAAFLPTSLWPSARLHSAEKVVATAREKQSLADGGAGQICDMESGLIAEVCRDWDLGFLSLRAISDLATEDLPVPPEILLNPQTGRPVPFTLMRYLLAHPKKILPFAKMVRNAKSAIHALHKALGPTLEQLAYSGQ